VDLETASWIIDAGANVGYTAIWFAERYPSSQIIAVEPDMENFEILCRNVAHESRITPVRAAITQPGAPKQFVIGGPTDTSPCAFQTVDFDPTAPDVNESDVVDAIDIATLMEQFGIERLDLLKMDIEGGEQAVFGECTDWIDRVEAIIVEVHDRFVPGCSETFDRATKDFAVRDIGPEGSFRVYVRRGTPTVVG
jgi:FkbM family methyltransferase